MRNLNRNQLVALVLGVGVVIAGCGGGGSSSPPPSSTQPPPATPPPPPPPPPPPSGGTVVPPLSATVQDVSDDHRVGTVHWGDPQTDGTPIGNFTCVLNPTHAFLQVAHVSIMLNNEPLALPGNIGASPTGNTHCFYTVHTHNSSGKVHVTPTVAGTYTLGNFFDIWKQPLTNTNVAGITGLPIEIFITDGTTTTKVEEADWMNIEMKDHRQITISVGTEVTEIPNFTWTGE